MLLAMAVTRREENSFGKEKSGNELWRKWCIPGLALLVAGIIWSITGGKEEERRAYVHWREEQSYFKMEIYKGTEENYGKLYPFLFQQPRFLFEYGLCLSRLGQYEAGSRLMQEATCLSADPMLCSGLTWRPIIFAGLLQQFPRVSILCIYFVRCILRAGRYNGGWNWAKWCWIKSLR